MNRLTPVSSICSVAFNRVSAMPLNVDWPTTSMRLAEGFTRPIPSVMIFVFYALSFGLNTLVIRVLGLSVVYGVWSGVGTVLTDVSA